MMCAAVTWLSLYVCVSALFYVSTAAPIHGVEDEKEKSEALVSALLLTHARVPPFSSDSTALEFAISSKEKSFIVESLEIQTFSFQTGKS